MLLPLTRGRSRRSRSFTSWVQRIDERMLDRLGGANHGPLGPSLKAMAVIGNLLVPYLAVTVWFLCNGRAEERAAVARGWGAAAIAGILQGWLLKPAAQRGRPDARRLPPQKRRKKTPSTSAFPSGHAGTGTAFSVAMARGAPRARWPLALATVLLQYAEVYTGRHYPSDILGGTAIGTGVGLLASRVRLEAPPPIPDGVTADS